MDPRKVFSKRVKKGLTWIWEDTRQEKASGSDAVAAILAGLRSSGDVWEEFVLVLPTKYLFLAPPIL